MIIFQLKWSTNKIIKYDPANDKTISTNNKPFQLIRVNQLGENNNIAVSEKSGKNIQPIMAWDLPSSYLHRAAIYRFQVI